MEFAQNGPLLDLVMSLHGKGEGVSEELAAFWFKRILEGAFFMHSRGFAHLDLKHDNILLDYANQPKLADFGFTRHTDGQLVDLKKYTKEYAAPEVLSYRGPYDGMKADIYCLGIVFYSTLTCKYPDRQNVATRWSKSNFST